MAGSLIRTATSGDPPARKSKKMTTHPVGHMLDPSLRVLQLPLGEFAEPVEVFGGGHGLPAGALYLPDANLVLASTLCDPPLFERAALDACLALKSDMRLQRTGLHPETLDPVTIEVALVTREGAAYADRLVYMRHRNRTLWLVPQETGFFVEIRADGLSISSVPSFITWSERCDGVCRAAAEIVRIVSRRRGH